jgi:hypothetical protein|tara:strand:+ start:45 stop:701 length:657 start_codon:yes stop_codon:yes gene_type:complete
MSGPFKMQGMSFKSSPVKQSYGPQYVDIGGKEVYPSLKGSKMSISGGKGIKPLSTFTLAPGISVGKFNFGGKYKGGTTKSKTGGPTGKLFTGGTATFSTGSGDRVYTPGFKGSISGEYGTTKQLGKGKKTTGYSGRVSLGIGRSGSGIYQGCPGGKCGENLLGYNIKAFGEHGSKGSYNPGTRVGLSGRVGPVIGEGSYNIKTKKPEFKVGVTIPINK